MINSQYKRSNGFIALLSTIIISAILLGIVCTVSQNQFNARFNLLHNEFKQISLGLAEGCVNIALTKIAQDYSYTPAISGENIALGSDVCTIQKVIYTPEVSGAKTATIKTQARYRGTWTNMSVAILVTNPGVTPTSLPPPAHIQIVSWREEAIAY